ncbi:MAG: 23S rRNA (uracil(1939)-C(5))-methyltransferase RlmD, partial [Erysipelotrichaceae bacterium]|nr:23S rRNA (uracil(1939)-C(5))-methyltransferase RlmD [Erysipelotrichaceae bacterium]
EKKAVEDAKENARINHFDHLSFQAEDAAKGIRNILKKKKVDALVVDPPRTGLDDELLKTLLLSKIGTIVYISCNPATLGKDLNVLKERYDIKLIRGYDMFPNTPLVETLVLLNRKTQGKKDL